jgi:predicted RNase H-like HicB family nuclease
MKVTAIIEKSKNDFYAVYVKDDLPGFGLNGTGYSEKEAKEDMLLALSEYKEMCLEENQPAPPELEFEYQYDLDSFPEMAVQKESTVRPTTKVPYRTASTVMHP